MTYDTEYKNSNASFVTLLQDRAAENELSFVYMNSGYGYFRIEQDAETSEYYLKYYNSSVAAYAEGTTGYVEIANVKFTVSEIETQVIDKLTGELIGSRDITTGNITDTAVSQTGQAKVQGTLIYSPNWSNYIRLSSTSISSGDVYASASSKTGTTYIDGGYLYAGNSGWSRATLSRLDITVGSLYLAAQSTEAVWNGINSTASSWVRHGLLYVYHHNNDNNGTQVMRNVDFTVDGDVTLIAKTAGTGTDDITGGLLYFNAGVNWLNGSVTVNGSITGELASGTGNMTLGGGLIHTDRYMNLTGIPVTVSGDISFTGRSQAGAAIVRGGLIDAGYGLNLTDSPLTFSNTTIDFASGEYVEMVTVVSGDSVYLQNSETNEQFALLRRIYELTTDTVAQEGVTYYRLAYDGTYQIRVLTPGQEIPDGTYVVARYEASPVLNYYAGSDNPALFVLDAESGEYVPFTGGGDVQLRYGDVRTTDLSGVTLYVLAQDGETYELFQYETRTASDRGGVTTVKDADGNPLISFRNAEMASTIDGGAGAEGFMMMLMYNGTPGTYTSRGYLFGGIISSFTSANTEWKNSPITITNPTVKLNILEGAGANYSDDWVAGGVIYVRSNSGTYTLTLSGTSDINISGATVDLRANIRLTGGVFHSDRALEFKDGTSLTITGSDVWHQINNSGWLNAGNSEIMRGGIFRTDGSLKMSDGSEFIIDDNKVTELFLYEGTAPNVNWWW